jgi:uncharacterized protein YndB with AHSA1/START domain
VTPTTKGDLLEIKRIFDAPPARVFDAWLNREEWQAWIGPEGVSCEVPLLEPRVGGRYRLTMHLSDGTAIPIAGVFKTIEAPKRLAFTWGREGDARATLVTVTLRAVNGKTELTLCHQGLPTVEDRDSHAKGWNSALNKLAAYVTTYR